MNIVIIVIKIMSNIAELIFGKDECDQMYEHLITQKNPLSLYVREILSNYSINNDENILSHCTFKHIVYYCKTGKDNGQLRIACSDFGISIPELDKFKQDKNCINNIIKSLLNRPMSKL